MKTFVTKVFTTEQCRINFGTLFIFGDNCMREGEFGQATIRNQKNAIGLSTKYSLEEYFTDDRFGENCQIVDEDIERIKNYAKEKNFKIYCFPFYGIGTGRAQMHVKAPKTFFYLCNRLLEEFNFNNIEGLHSKQF
jgi:hypothetical protein